MIAISLLINPKAYNPINGLYGTWFDDEPVHYLAKELMRPVEDWELPGREAMECVLCFMHRAENPPDSVMELSLTIKKAWVDCIDCLELLHA